MKLKACPCSSRFSIVERIRALGNRKAGENLRLEAIEDILIEADVGAATAAKIMEAHGLRHSVDDVLPELRERMLGIFAGRARELNMNPSGPTVMLIAGVNGTGKTTTIGKLAWFFKERGKKVLLAASDTFRDGAVEQLEIWAGRAGAGVVRHSHGADPSAVAYDAAEAAAARGIDILLVDTAGRLHTKGNLVEEIKKIKNVIGRKIPGAPHEVMLILDATTGQNAMSQAGVFLEALEITSIGLTKLDGTARGGIVLAIEDRLGVPVKIVGTGEAIDELDFFDPARFVEALLSPA